MPEEHNIYDWVWLLNTVKAVLNRDWEQEYNLNTELDIATIQLCNYYGA